MKELNHYFSAVVIGFITLLSITPSAHALKSSTLDTANSYGVVQQQTISQYQNLPPLEDPVYTSPPPATCGYSGLPPLNSTQEEFDRWDRCESAERARVRSGSTDHSGSRRAICTGECVQKCSTLSSFSQAAGDACRREVRDCQAQCR
ncbi:hypothetical protein [Pseudanabaena sp. 'Roaring Creek']|uniref:hypothetical protein n=1 Tax=Pseudanabaena sp. 'Roaring Creek' TaxID=1681830 RepID=UPI000A41547D|nr:hypothetical protein [Pseudanabaena sp. 'Roaring Creek']